MTDVIDLLAGFRPKSPLDAIRAARPDARAHAQRSFTALFEPDVPDEVSLAERYGVAAFVAGLHRDPATTAFYGTHLATHAPDLTDVVAEEIASGLSKGPYGTYPDGPLTTEGTIGPLYRVAPVNRKTLGQRLTVAFEHAHLLVFHPRDATPQLLRSLLEAGWTTDGIVTLSQLVAFLAFQIRAVQGLRTLAAAPHFEERPS